MRKLAPGSGRVSPHQPLADGKLDKLGAIMYAQLLHDIGAMGHYRLDAEEKHVGNLLHGVSFGDKLQHLLLPVAQFLVKRLRLGYLRFFQKPLDYFISNGGVEKRLAL